MIFEGGFAENNLHEAEMYKLQKSETLHEGMRRTLYSSPYSSPICAQLSGLSVIFTRFCPVSHQFSISFSPLIGSWSSPFSCSCFLIWYFSFLPEITCSSLSSNLPPWLAQDFVSSVWLLVTLCDFCSSNFCLFWTFCASSFYSSM